MSYSNKTLIASVGAAVALSASFHANSTENPFSSTELSSGYEVLTQQEKKSANQSQSDKVKHKAKQKMMEEGKCGEGKCGEAMMADKAKQKMAEKAKEGKCGEGKCGEAMMADKAKQKMSDKAKKAGEKAKEGKCGEGKCGAA